MDPSFVVRASAEALKCNIAGIFPNSVNLLGSSPLAASLRLTSRCSAQCQSCNFWMERDHNELTTAQWKEIILDLKSRGFLQLAFTGGDIIIRKDVFELLRFSVGLGMKVRCAINGYTVTENIARELMNSNVATIAVSLDDVGEEFDNIRGVKQAADKVRRCFELFNRFDNGTTKFIIAATIMKETLTSIQPVVEYATQQAMVVELNLIDFTHYFFNTSFSKEQYELDPSEKNQLRDLLHWLAAMHEKFPTLVPRLAHLEWIRDYFDDYRQKSSRCYQVYLKLCIEPNGDVRTCCSLGVVGNLIKQNANQVLRSTRYLDQVKRGITKDCPGCSCRYALSLNANIGSYAREGLLRLGAVKI